MTTDTTHKLTSDRPTICHVIHALGVGGAEVLVEQMVRRMSDEFRCVIAVLDEVGEIGERLRRDGFIVEHLNRQPGIDRGCARRLRDFADREGAVLLHAHQYTPFFQAMLSRGFFGRRPIVFTEHGRHVPDLPSRKRSIVNRLLLQRQDRLVGCGEAVRQALIANEGLPSSRVEVVLNGVDLDALSSPSPDARHRVRTEFGFEANDFVAILVARLHPLKDHQTAVRTADIVRRSCPHFRLLLAGDGDERAAIESSIKALGLSDNVKLAGTRTDVADLLAASDAFLMSSISEGIPLTVIEAMAARKPVVATRVGGLPELVEHERSGFLSPAGNAESLAAQLLKLVENHELRSRMGDIGSQRAREQFSLHGMLDKYRRIYREVGNARRHIGPMRKSSNATDRPANTVSAATAPTNSADSPMPGSLLVFSDDWGRHPSSCQHLIRSLMRQHKLPVVWVNTIGTRAPRLNWMTMRRVAEKLGQWILPRRTETTTVANADHAQGVSDSPRVVSPRMWPWFSGDGDRRLNRRLLAAQLNPILKDLPRPIVAVTTLPITADLPGALHVDRWVYYCVDDFSQWPGLDGQTLRRMDQDMIRRADSIVAVSETLQGLIAAEGRTSSLLTHGVDVEFWRPEPEALVDFQTPVRLAPQAQESRAHADRQIENIPAPRVVFWGVIDRRMDLDTIQQLSRELPQCSLVLIGPQQDPDPRILTLSNVFTLPAQPLAALPAIAAKADVLMMPYADLPVTRAMQPLKLKEYLATGRPVVVNQLPSTLEWTDCLDVATSPAEFVSFVKRRLVHGLPAAQQSARKRLHHDSWDSRATQLLKTLCLRTEPHTDHTAAGTECLMETNS